MRILLYILLFLSAATLSAQKQPLDAIIYGQCDSMGIFIPLGGTIEDARIALDGMRMTEVPIKAENQVMFTSEQEDLFIVAQFDYRGRISSMSLFLTYGTLSKAQDAAWSFRRLVAQTWKTLQNEHLYLQCNDHDTAYVCDIRALVVGKVPFFGVFLKYANVE